MVENNNIQMKNEEWVKAIQNHYTNFGIADLPINIYREPIYFGKFKNSDESVNSAYLALKDEQPTYVILSEEEHKVKAEISKTENLEDMDEFVYVTLQDSSKDLREKVETIMSYVFMQLVRKL